MDEIHWTEHYVLIMCKRYEGAFEFEKDVDQEALSTTVPKFFLQPLVENAVIHGFHGINEGGKLTVSGHCIEGKLVISIQDNGVGMSPEQCRTLLEERESPGSIGIANVHQRLTLIYGEKYTMEIKSELGKGTQLILHLPL